VFDDSYLAPVSAQGLRTTVVVGRPDFGMPGFLDTPKPLAPQEVSDVAAFLWSQRAEFLGQLPPDDSPLERTNAQHD
jgi:cytochrome c oxidase cbb3-type subunit 3/ubiquinol-cytochrome c reductase cytochrome c subunit